MKKPRHHLIVEAGPDKGLSIVVPPHGIRVGRSSNNDVALKDPTMSNFHCRFCFKPDNGLWAEDLGSTNQTLLNQAPLCEARLRIGDRLLLGDTTIQVVNDCLSDVTNSKLFDTPTSNQSADGKIEFHRHPNEKQPNRKPLRAALMILFILLAASVALVWIYKMTPNARGTDESKPSDSAHAQELTISYEKVQADTKNIFRYALELEANELSIQISDLQNKRQVAGQQRRQVAPDLLQSLADTIERTGFFALKESYQGVASDAWDMIDLTVTIGRKTHQVQVLNTMEPPAFKTAREAIEEFGQNELGLAALALAPEKLVDLARAAALLGRSLYDQRDVKHDNLAKAIRSLHEVEWYMETIEPKPDFYAGAVALRGNAESELQTTTDNLFFLAERAIRLKDWNEAALQLRLLCEKIQDRADNRHQKARKKLIDVERHLKKK